MITSENSNERRTAARRIWTDWEEFEDPSEFYVLEEHLLLLLQSEQEERNIWHVMIVLGLLNSKKAIPLLVNKLTTSDKENIRGFAADALGRYPEGMLSTEIIDLLWDFAENDDSLVVRINSIRACSSSSKGTKDKEVSMRLIELLKTQSHSAIQTTIIQQIGSIGNMDVCPDLIHIMITRRTETTKKIAGIALDEIAKINGFQDRDDLIKMMKNNIQ